MSSASPSRQAKISTFFSPPKRKRPAEPKTDSDKEPPLKKQKATETIQPVASSSQRPSERWRFNSSPAETGILNPNYEATAATREAFKKKLLGPTNRSKAVELEPSTPTHSIESDSDSDHAFEELSEFFSSKSGSGKGKGRKAVPKPKSVEEIGPSGKKYTALEKQVSLH